MSGPGTPDGEAEHAPGFLDERPPFLKAARWALRPLRWFERASVGVHMLGVVVLLGILYAAGLAIGYEQGDAEQVLRFYFLPVMLVEIGWGVFAIDWARGRYKRILWDWRKNFGEWYQDTLYRHWRRLCHDKESYWVTAPAAAAVAGYIIGIRVSHGSTIPIPSISQPIVLGSPAEFVYITIVGAILGYVGGWGIYIIIEHTRFLHSLSQKHLIAFRVITGESEIKELAEFSLMNSVNWFVALAIVSPIFFTNINRASISGYIAATLIGFVAFILPQFYLHDIMVRAKSTLVRELRDTLPSGVQETQALTSDVRAMSILTLIRTTDQMPDWPIDIRVVMTEVLGVLLPVVTGILGAQFGLRFAL